MSAVETLTKARELIARPGGWTQGAFARNKNGDSCKSSKMEAVCWCMRGAMNLAQASTAESLVCKAIGSIFIAEWNDAPGRTQADVVAAFDRAIAFAQAGALS